MNLKPLAIVTAVLVLAAAGATYWHQQRTAGTAPGRVGEQVMPTLSAGDIARVRIEGPKNRVHLVRQDGTWHVEEQQGFLADDGKLSEFLLKLNEAILAHKVTERAELRAKLGVLTPEENDGERKEEVTATRVTLMDEDGETVFDLLVGNEREGGGPQTFGGQYVRFPGEEATYLVGETLFVDTQPNQWIERTVFDVEAKTTLQAITVERPEGETLRFTRAEPEAEWALEGAAADELNQEEITALANNLAGMQIVSVAPEGESAEALGRAQTGRVTMRFFDGRSYTIEVGTAQGLEKRRYATMSAALDASTDDNSLQRQVERFNRVYGDRTFALYDWDGKRLLTPRQNYLAQKGGSSQ